jgi:hypothetical protein
MPTWVQVWWWMRFLRHPQVMTPLPHQGINPEAMSMDRYDALHSEWVKAGSPRTSIHKIVAVMSGSNPLVDDIPF